ncbi:unnamed protein product [Caenorhabditis brenneri]
MPSQTKKKDTVSKNMGARYAPIERALRPTPHVIVCDVSSSSPAPPLVMARFETPQPEPPRTFFNPSSMTVSSNSSGTPASTAPQATTSAAAPTAVGMDASAAASSEKAVANPVADDDTNMDWESN